MSLAEIDRTRKDLAESFAAFGYRHIAEIGVEQGVFSEILCKANPKAKIYCIDAWKAYRGYRDHTRQSKLDRFYEITKERLKPYHHQIIRKFSLDAVNDFADGSLDAVYIDANHSYQSVLDDITAWIKKVRKYGVMSRHDYVRRKGQDQYYAVVDAVNDYAKANHIDDLVIYKGDSPASWAFIKL